MAKPSNLPSTPENAVILIAKPATPLLLPPSQIEHTKGNNPSITSSPNSKNSTSSSDDDHTHHTNPNTIQNNAKHRRRPLHTDSNYRQTMLQPTMAPMMKTPCLNPTLFSVNSAESPSITSPLHRNDSLRSLQPHLPPILHPKYTKVITTNPVQPSIDDEMSSNDFIPMDSSKPSIDHARLIPSDILTRSEQHDEDQKIVETISIMRDEHIDDDHEYITQQTQYHHKYNNISVSSFPNLPARGIPTTPSYPTPISSQQPMHSDDNVMRLINSAPHAYAHTTHHRMHPTAPHASGSLPPPPIHSAPATYRRAPSQFMVTQQHRKRTHKLKFTRAKWSEHGKRVLLNTTVRVDRVCHTLVQTRQRFGVCPVEMRELSLTVAVIERAMYSYGRQVQECKVKSKRQRSSQRTSTFYTAHNHPNNSIPNTIQLGRHMRPSISAPSQYTVNAEREHINGDTLSETVHSEDSLETIGRCTNTSIVTGTTYVRTHSPMNQSKLSRHQRNISHMGPPHYTSPNTHGQRRYRTEQWGWRHPGGVVSLLEILGRVLKRTEEQLVAIGNIASLTDFVQKNKAIWVICLVAGGYICAVPFRGPIQFMLEQCSNLTSFFAGRIAPSGASKGIVFIINYMIRNVFFRFIPSRLRSIFNKWIRYLISSLMSMFERITAIESVSFWMNRFRFMILPTLIYMLHRMVLRMYLERLKKSRNELQTVILHWQLCMTAMTPSNRLDQSLSDRLHHYRMDTSLTAYSHSKIDIYQWILRLVPPSAHIDACFWYSANTRLRLLRKLIDINYAVTSYYYRIFGSSTLFWPMAFPILMYYIVNPHRAACRANEFLANPDIRIIRVLYSILDSKLARWVTLKLFPKMRLMPSLKTAITFEIRVDDINDDDLNLKYDFGHGATDDDLDPLPGLPWLHNIDTVRIKIFSTKKLNIKPDYTGDDGEGAEFLNENVPSNLILNEQHQTHTRPAHTIIPSNLASVKSLDLDVDVDMDVDVDIDMDVDSEPINPLIDLNNVISHSLVGAQPISKQENGVIFYIHGGGFLGNFCASDLRILSQWSDLVNAPIVEVDYSLMPSKWPQQLAEAILAYKCLCFGRLGFNARRIAVIGDSNGGGLAVSMVINIIQCGLRVPDVLILTSPVLSLRQNLPTTSRLLFNMDPLVPMNLIVQLTKYYLIPTICDDENDPHISPLVAAPDYLLSSFPPTTIVVGGLDPFLDDSIDFAHRLSNADVNVDVKLKIYKFAPHAFLNFNYILPDVNHAIHLIAECIDQAFLN